MMTDSVLDKVLSRVRGQYCWNVEYEPALEWLTMELGAPRLHIIEPHRTNAKSEYVREMSTCRRVVPGGEWWLALSSAYWSIWRDKRKLATGASALRKIRRACSNLSGQKLMEYSIDPKTGETVLGFDLGGALKVRRRESNPEKELWFLLEQSKGLALSVRTDGSYVYEPADKKPEK